MRYGEMIRPREVGGSGGGNIGHDTFARAAFIDEALIVRASRLRCRRGGIRTRGKHAAFGGVICQNRSFWPD